MSRTTASVRAAARKQKSERRIELVREELRRMEAADAPRHVPLLLPAGPARPVGPPR